MGCKELKITDYYRFLEPDEKSYSHAGEIPCTAEKNRYKPVFHTVISNYRYYSPELGRWLSRDPIGERGGINLYGMVGNDPVNCWDNNGLAGIPWALKAFVALESVWATVFYARAYDFYVTRFDEICDQLSPGQEYVEIMLPAVYMIVWKDKDCICWPDVSFTGEHWETGIYELPTEDQPPGTPSPGYETPGIIST